MNSALILEQNIKNKIILISKILLTEENFQKSPSTALVVWEINDSEPNVQFYIIMLMIIAHERPRKNQPTGAGIEDPPPIPLPHPPLPSTWAGWSSAHILYLVGVACQQPRLPLSVSIYIYVCSFRKYDKRRRGY